MDIRVGHSPDPDDAFMYWALTTDLVDRRGFAFEQVLADIQTLNQWARAARLEVTAISLAAYPFVQEDYALLPHGASIGTGYGPIVVAREPASLDDLRGKEIVVPGAMTTAFLTLRLALGDCAFRELAFEQIPDEIASGRADYGLLIHEGQLTFADIGLHKVLDLGEWWLLETGLPLPLGVNVARRDIERLGDLSEVLAEGISCGLEHRDEALEYALQFGRGIDEAVADRFIEMYVNELTEDYGDEGRSAVAEAAPSGRGDRCLPGARRDRLRVGRRARLCLVEARRAWPLRTSRDLLSGGRRGTLGNPRDDEVSLLVRHAGDVAERHRTRGHDPLDVVRPGGDLLGRIEHDACRGGGEPRLGRALRVAGRAALLDDRRDLRVRDGGDSPCRPAPCPDGSQRRERRARRRRRPGSPRSSAPGDAG